MTQKQAKSLKAGDRLSFRSPYGCHRIPAVVDEISIYAVRITIGDGMKAVIELDTYAGQRAAKYYTKRV